MTDTALDEACYAANDLTIFLDEFSRLEGNAQKKREKAKRISLFAHPERERPGQVKIREKIERLIPPI